MSFLRASEEVADALAEGRAVVALETTIVTHGMPAPVNVETALACEAEIRAAGAVPATIAVIAGEIRAGLSADEIGRLAETPGVAKLSRADFAATLAAGGTGSTTVAATLIAAAEAGIAVFATGGIGGVHRGAGESFDVSADLRELARQDLVVVAAGAKAILDLSATLEVLETLGVPVVAYGQDAFPAFWSRESGLAAPLRADTAREIALTRQAARRVGALGHGGMLVANPIPSDAEIPREVIAPMIETALAEAAAGRITGKAVTPFLLDRIFQLSEGASLTANVALVRANARLGAEIALEIAGLSKDGA